MENNRLREAAQALDGARAGPEVRTCVESSENQVHRTMIRPDDNMLMDYADGKLDTGEQFAVEAYLKTDESARQLVDAFRKSRTLLAQAFDDPMRAAPPRALIDTIRGAPAREGARPEASILGFKTRSRPGHRFGYALPLAASIALVAGFGMGMVLGRLPSAPAPAYGIALGSVAPDSALARMLETAPSGSRIAVTEAGGSPLSFELVATFRDARGRPCREVDVSAAANGLTIASGVACRSGESWTVEGAFRLAEAPQAGGAGYVPSGLPEKDAVDGLLAALGIGPALPAKEEAELIGRRWR